MGGGKTPFTFSRRSGRWRARRNGSQTARESYCRCRRARAPCASARGRRLWGGRGLAWALCTRASLSRALKRAKCTPHTRRSYTTRCEQYTAGPRAMAPRQRRNEPEPARAHREERVYVPPTPHRTTRRRRAHGRFVHGRSVTLRSGHSLRFLIH